MTIRHMEIFTAVADTGGMSAAAKKLHISQPTVSAAIAEMERNYGVKLFERLSQKIYITKEGELMLSFSRHILDSFGQMEEALKQSGQNTRLRVGCSVSVGTCMINDILDLAEEVMPQCVFQIQVANSSDIEAAVLDNEADVGIVEGIIKSRDLITIPVCKDELVLVCGSTHKLAGEKQITMQMLENQDYISRESGSAERNQLEKMFEDYGLHLTRAFCSTNTEAIKNAVKKGRGIAILSKRLIEKEVKDKSIVILPLEGAAVYRYFQFIMHKNKYQSACIKDFQKLLLTNYGEKD